MHCAALATQDCLTRHFYRRQQLQHQQQQDRWGEARFHLTPRRSSRDPQRWGEARFHLPPRRRSRGRGALRSAAGVGGAPAGPGCGRRGCGRSTRAAGPRRSGGARGNLAPTGHETETGRLPGQLIPGPHACRKKFPGLLLWLGRLLTMTRGSGATSSSVHYEVSDRDEEKVATPTPIVRIAVCHRLTLERIQSASIERTFCCSW